MNHTSYTVIGNAEARQMQKKIGKRDNKDALNIFGKSSGMSSARTALYSYFLSLLIPISPSHIAPPYKAKNKAIKMIGKTCPSKIFRQEKIKISTRKSNLLINLWNKQCNQLYVLLKRTWYYM